MGARSGRETRQGMRRTGLRALAAFGMTVGAVTGFAVAIGLVITTEGLLAFERIGGGRFESATARSGTFGGDRSGRAISLGMMGDSLAVGYGAESEDRVPGVLIARGLVEASDRPVVLTNVAQVGAESTALGAQLTRLLAATVPDVVVIVVGANDVMHLKSLTSALRPLSETVRRLHDGGTQVVVATCPDLGTVHPFTQPLRFVLHWYSRVLATGQAIVTLRGGGRSVSLADALGPLFHLDPEDLFSPRDHLHPSSAGYLATATVLLPSVRVAAGCPLPGEEHVPHRIYRKDSRRPLARWAFRATRRIEEGPLSA